MAKGRKPLAPKDLAGSAELSGGQGETTRADLQLVEQAIRNEWPISANRRKILIKEAFEIIEGRGKVAHRIGAMRVVVAADAVNARRETGQKAGTPPSPANVNVNVNVSTVERIDAGFSSLVAAIQATEGTVCPDGGGQSLDSTQPSPPPESVSEAARIPHRNGA